MNPVALQRPFCCLFSGAYTPPTSARLWSCCGLQSSSVSFSFSFSCSLSLPLFKTLLGWSYLIRTFCKISFSLFVSAIQQTLLSTLGAKILKSCGLAGLIMKFWLCLTGVQRSLLHKPILHLRSLTFSNKIQSLYVNLCKTGGVRISVYHPSPLH